jgi:vesicle transport through interaction with t-SNAREs 1
LSRIRSYFAAPVRDPVTLQECERLLQQAKQCATAMQAMAEVEGNELRMQTARHLLERDIGPLSKEIQRTLQTMQQQTRRDELLTSSRSASTYQAPRPLDLEFGGTDMDALIQSSDDLLRESQSILVETEQIGDQTIHQLHRQREQLSNAHRSLQVVQAAMEQSGRLLKSMSRRACRSRLFLHMMIGTLIALNLFVLYCIYEKHAHHKSSSNSPP